ncbi:FtsQ-type POTRA domain-containing protein [Candidatus Poribacteria bacterium]|nr:FtsQ-type POTRA domain-containing protein [Candidatus Poribacteria bacterium]
MAEAWEKGFGRDKRSSLGMDRAPVPRPKRRRGALPPPQAVVAGDRTERASRRATRPDAQPALPRRSRLSRRTVQRRAKRYRWYFVILLAMAAVGVAGFEAYQYRSSKTWGSELFLLEQVAVEGAQRISESELIDSAGLVINTTTMQEVVPKRIEETLSTAYPDLKSVEVAREMPGRAVIRVVERVPVARVRIGSETHIVDEEGVVLVRPFVIRSESHLRAEPQTHTPAHRNPMAPAPMDAVLLARESGRLPWVEGPLAIVGEPVAHVEGTSLASALDLVAMNARMSLSDFVPNPLPPVRAVVADEGGSGTVRVERDPAERVLRRDEIERRPLSIERVRALGNGQLVVTFRQHARRGVTAWFSEGYLSSGLSNLYRVYVHRLLTVPTRYSGLEDADGVASSVADSSSSLPPSSPHVDVSRESSPSPASGAGSRVEEPVASAGADQEQESHVRRANVAADSQSADARKQRPWIEERYDARYESTLYISSIAQMSGGQNGAGGHRSRS